MTILLAPYIAIKRLLLSRNILVIFLLSLFCSNAFATTKEMVEMRIKLAFMFKFAEFIEGNWESATNDQKVIINILGPYNDEEKSYLRMFENKTIKSKAVKINFNSKDIKNSDVLFFSKNYQPDPKLLIKKSKKGTLIVSDKAYFLGNGGIVEFFDYRGKVRFKIDNDTAIKSGIKFNAKLLELAAIG